MKNFIHPSLSIIFFLWKISLSQVSVTAIDAVPKFGRTRALSMGGVTIATSQGIEALSGNPGGLALLDGIQIAISGSARLYGKSDFYESFYTYLECYSSKINKSFGLTDLGIVFPISIPKPSIKLVGAVGYRRFYDWNHKKEEEWYDDYDEGNIKSKRIYEIEGALHLLSLGLGTVISERCSFGMSINFPVRKGVKTETQEESQNLYEKHTYRYTENWDVSAKYFIQWGGVFQVFSKLSVGAFFSMNHKFILHDRRSSVSYKVTRTTHYNYEGDDKNEWEIPTTFDFGIAYRLKPHLLLAAEAQSRPWANWRINDLPIYGVENGNAYRLGIEYGKRIQYRAGFAVDRLPLLDANDDPVNIKSVSAGIGFPMNPLIVDMGASYQFTTFDADKRGSIAEYHIRELKLSMSLTYNSTSNR
jgi:hypothetical protein